MKQLNILCHSKLVNVTNIRKDIDQSIQVEDATDDVEKGNNVVFIA